MTTEKPTRVEVNCETGETVIIELTDAEIAAREEIRKDSEKKRLEAEAEAKAKADAKLAAQAKLQALGLSGEEVAALTE